MVKESEGRALLRTPAGLQLVVLLDDSSRGNLGLQLNDIRSFLGALPPTAQVAIGYMRNGTADLVQNFTSGQDKIHLQGFSNGEVASALATQTLTGGNVKIALSDGTQVTFQGLGHPLTGSDFT